MGDEPVGRAGFHVRHTKDAAERGAILHEMMRELDDDAVAYWAARNPSIVVADEILNEAYVNDGQGGYRPCSDRSDVLEYGQRRLWRVGRKLREDKLNPKNGKMEGGTVTTTLVVSHLPKSMCREIPDFYPVLTDRDKYLLDENGAAVLDGEGQKIVAVPKGSPVLDANGDPLRRSRWVARDRDEARRYFLDVGEYLTGDVVSGGQEAMLGFDIQHSETTPHAQYLLDAFAQDPKKPGNLRAVASQDWFAHRDVRGEDGKIKPGPQKMREYHAGLKQHLIAKGYDISADFDEERHLSGMGKAEYERSQEAKLITERKLKPELDEVAALKAQLGEAMAAAEEAQLAFTLGIEDLERQGKVVEKTPVVAKALRHKPQYTPSIPITYPDQSEEDELSR